MLENITKILSLFTYLDKSPDIIISPENYNDGKYDTESKCNHEKYYLGKNIKSEEDYEETKNGLQVYYAGMVAYSILAKVDLKSMEKDEIKEHFKKDIFLNASLLLIESSFVEQCIVFNKKKKPNRRPTIQQMLDHPYLKRNLPENFKVLFASKRGKYIIDKKENSHAQLNAGAFGEVYVILKWVPKLKINYYIEKKIVREGAIEIAKREVEINKIIREKNIKGCVQSFQEYHKVEKKVIKIRMQYFKGIELSTIAKNYKILPENIVREIMKSAVEGYAALHKNDIIVRDIKPGNILVGINKDNKYEAKIIDFGNAKIISSNNDALVAEDQTARRGTATTIAPEVLYGKSYGFSSDIFSVGAIIYRLLMGDYVMNSQVEEEMKKLYENETIIPKERKLSLDAIDLIDKCMRIDPEKRFKSMDKLLKHPFFDLESDVLRPLQVNDGIINKSFK